MTSRDPGHEEPVLEAALRALADDDRRVEAPAALYDAVMARWDTVRAAPPRRRWTAHAWLGRAAALAAAAVLAIAWIIGLPHTVGAPPETGVGGIDVRSPLTASLPAGESLHLVKVRMPRTALRAFGVALVDPEATGEVEVDVVVGEDGFPRSIRRVQRLPAGHRQE